MGNNAEYYDLHAHFLPGMDDGAKDCRESLEMLQLSATQGIVGIISTSHYYPQETVAQFLVRRSEAYSRLQEQIALTRADVPEIVLGAEVAYHSGLIYDDDLAKLCFGKSRYLLLELPFSKWSPSVLRDVKSFYNVCGVMPIIAHLERYYDIQDRRVISELLDCNVYVQMNGEYYLDKRSRRKAKKSIKHNRVHVMGSDAHNMKQRTPNLGPALALMEQEKLPDYVEEIVERSKRIFLQARDGGDYTR